jgi:hypothetical protein
VCNVITRKRKRNWLLMEMAPEIKGKVGRPPAKLYIYIYVPITKKLDQIWDRNAVRAQTHNVYTVNSRPSLCGRLVSKLVTAKQLKLRRTSKYTLLPVHWHRDRLQQSFVSLSIVAWQIKKIKLNENQRHT